MWGRRTPDKILFFIGAWVILLGLTTLAVYYGVLVPVTKVSTWEKITIILSLPTLATAFSIILFFIVKFEPRK